jgi:hypothetical protein
VEDLGEAGEPGMEQEAVDVNLTVTLRSLPERYLSPAPSTLLLNSERGYWCSDQRFLLISLFSALIRVSSRL